MGVKRNHADRRAAKQARPDRLENCRFMWMPCELDFDSAFDDTLKAQEARRPRSAASGPRPVGYVLSNFNPSGPNNFIPLSTCKL